MSWGRTARHATVAAIVAAAIAMPASAAPAAPVDTPTESRPRVVVPPTAFEGELNEAFRPLARRKLLDGLARSQYEVVASEAGATEVPGDYVVESSLSTESRNYRLELRVRDRSGTTLASVSETCELCGIGEVEEMVADEAASLADKLASLVATRPLLVIDSRPQGALTLLDGRQIGTTPLALAVVAGKHRISARLHGYFDQEFDVDAITGMRQAVSLQLVPIPAAPSLADRRRAAFKPWGAASVTTGIVALVAGAVLIAIDERPFRRECSGGDIDDEGNCRLRYDTLGGGIGLVVSGAVLTITGASLLGLAFREGPRPRRTRP